MKHKNKGQSTVEYILLITAVIMLVLFFMRRGGPFHQGLNQTMDTLSNGMVDRSTLLSGFYNSI